MAGILGARYTLVIPSYGLTNVYTFDSRSELVNFLLEGMTVKQFDDYLSIDLLMVKEEQNKKRKKTK